MVIAEELNAEWRSSGRVMADGTCLSPGSHEADGIAAACHLARSCDAEWRGGHDIRQVSCAST